LFDCFRKACGIGLHSFFRVNLKAPTAFGSLITNLSKKS
jgi:hypothetical protein